MSGADWPIELVGVIESVITTKGPNGRWNAAALGIRSPASPGEEAMARTWGRTRTRRNLDREGDGYVQFVTDPARFVEAALGILESDDPILEEAAAWIAVTAQRDAAGSTDGTAWVDWTLQPAEHEVLQREVPRLDRATGAIVELTIAASRLDVPGYDEDRLRGRFAYFASVVRRCGGPRDREALALAAELADLTLDDWPVSDAGGDPTNARW